MALSPFSGATIAAQQLQIVAGRITALARVVRHPWAIMA